MEQRVIKLDIETAKEWYNQGGELKKVALQAFTARELNPKVQVWEDISTLKGYFIDINSRIKVIGTPLAADTNKNIALTERHCKKILAIAQISQLMPYYGGGITDKEWGNSFMIKYAINRMHNHLLVDEALTNYRFLAFHTKEQRNDFLQYNERLVRDYYMMD